jgi:hypothetical protein
MKKVLFLLVAIIVSTGTGILPCRATDHIANEHAVDHNEEALVSLIRLAPETATPDNITSLLGKPGRIEDNKKRTIWYYEHDSTTLVVSWSKKSAQMEKFSFNNTRDGRNIFDVNKSRHLQSGVTNVTDALKILGTPSDMTIKGMTQEMHYDYKNNVLRLFFRNKMLVDYTLY